MRFAILLCLFFHFFLAAIDLNLPLSAYQNAANDLTLFIPSTSITAIQPALIKSGFETGFTNLYALKELPYYFFHSAYQLKKMGIYFGNSHLAHEFYVENQTYLACNYQLKAFSFGLQTRYLFNKVPGYHSLSKILYDVGFAYSGDSHKVAFCMKNATQTTAYEIDLPTYFIWETNYKINQFANVSVGIEKQKHFDFLFRIAAFYQVIPFFALVTSYQYDPQRIGAGTAVNYGKWDMMYSVRTHQYLDLTHFISLSYALSP
jgi:hypothetical protein